MVFSLLHFLALIFSGVILGLGFFVAFVNQAGTLFFLIASGFYPLSLFMGLGATFVLGNFRFLKKTIDVITNKATHIDLENTSGNIGEQISFWPFLLVLCFNSFWLFWIFGFWTQKWFGTWVALFLGGLFYALHIRYVVKKGIINKIMDDLFGGDNF